MNLPFDLSAIQRITFYKRDEITTDLICCDVEAGEAGRLETWTKHEESDSWADWLSAFDGLPGFNREWYSMVLSHRSRQV